jgi:acetamidase/formamidase
MFRRSCHPQDAYTNAVNTYRNKTEFNNDQAYQMCGFQLKFRVFQTLLQNDSIICNMV